MKGSDNVYHGAKGGRELVEFRHIFYFPLHVVYVFHFLKMPIDIKGTSQLIHHMF